MSYVWGIDVAVSHLAFGLAPLDGGDVELCSLRMDTEHREGQRLGLIDRQLRLFAKTLNGAFPADAVWVEQPSGRFPKPQLMYVAGVVQAALFETLACPVWTVPVATWKQRSVGKGNATKEQVMAWVRNEGGDPSSQDEADAYGIAAAGRAMVLSLSWDGSVTSKEAA